MGRPDYKAMAAVFKKARDAGLAAAAARVPVPMIVVNRANSLDDNSPIVSRYAPVMGGVCGFAWVKIKPANSAFARWCKAEGIGHKDSYAGGWSISCSDFGQSMEKKEAYADAFADVLQAEGIRAYAQSRMD